MHSRRANSQEEANDDDYNFYDHEDYDLKLLLTMTMMSFEFSTKILKNASLCDAIDAQISDHKKDEEYV